jgi:hypothetical protein
MAEGTHARAVRELFDDGEVREVLRDTFYRNEAPLASIAKTSPEPKKKRRAAKPKAAHYEIICISLYNEDLARLDQKVADLKARGHRRMTRSALIRWALDQVQDLEAVPRGI